jgi:nondiscriminating aspartyl-tRNA synthetase
MDLEMGFIASEQDLIALQVRLLRHMFEHVRNACASALEMHGAQIPAITAIPQVTLEEAMRILTRHCKWQPAAGTTDLDPEGERLLCDHFLRQEGSDLVYVTRYPRSTRPFYALPVEGTDLTHSFDLLFRGLEITTGGQRIHRSGQLVESIAERGLDPCNFSDYLQCFRYGMPPHGGLAIGLERLAKQLLGLSNVKLAALFPRDRNRLTP